MDLIDKKLSEKLKLFEYIDKKYGTNIDESNLKKRDTASNTGSKDIILQKEIYSNNNNELYDNIYSDFKTNSYKYYFYTPLDNTADSNITNITNHYSKLKLNNLKKADSKNKRYKDNNISRDKELLTNANANGDTNRSNLTLKAQKKLSKLYPPNDSGDRLYNYGYYIKNKLIKKREKEDENIKRQMTPKILNRSKEMIKDKYRDPNKFEERLYYAERNNTNEIIIYNITVYPKQRSP